MKNFSFALENVTVRFRQVVALDRVTLRIRRGEAVALVGPSGAGKTTLLRLMNGSVQPESGIVLIGGRPLFSMSPQELRRVRADIAFVHQDLCLVPNLRVVQNVVSGRLGRLSLLRGLRAVFLTPRALAIEAHEVLERVGIPDKLYERTDRLSGGERQRVAIARALFQRPVALVADEPVSSVDPARARETIRLLSSISLEYGLTLCVSLHNLHLAREFFPRLVGLRGGRVLFDEAATDITPAQFDSLYRLDRSEAIEDAG